MNKTFDPEQLNLSTKQQAKELTAQIVKLLEDGKAENIVTIDLANKADFADFIIVASGTSSRHIASLGEALVSELKALGLDNIGIEGKILGDWVLVDAHDVIIHLFRPEIRENYTVDKLWTSGFSNELSTD